MNVHDRIIEPYATAGAPGGFAARVFHEDDPDKTDLLNASSSGPNVIISN